MDNFSQQSDEIEALKAIFDELWVIESETGSYSIQISEDVKLFITLSAAYPSDCAPTYELLAPTLSFEDKTLIAQEFKNLYEENLGSPILFQWIEKLKEIVQTKTSCKPEKILTDFNTGDEVIRTKEKPNLSIIHGSVIQDRKSTFQGHACSVHNKEDVKYCMHYLLDNKKIAQATHNITAYRIMLPNNVLLQDFEDDGETHAGGRLLHLLEILELKNVMVVVSRWYGGIHLGPDRFKHINNAARLVLIDAGLIKSSKND